ncbi:MAG TPA: hypothetical protein VI814_03580 [Candidatus Limnocylindria bacterium]
MRILLVSLVFLVVRLATAMVVSQPGYTDSYYFTDVAVRLAHGQGLTADFLWSPIEGGRDPLALALPVASHLFWVPLPTVIAAIGIALFGSFIDTFRSAQLPFILIAAFLPALTHRAACVLGAEERYALGAAIVVGLGGLLAPGLVAVDAFVPAALIGTAFFIAYRRAAAGGVRWGIAAGALVGLLYLARTEGALFGLTLLALLAVPRARAAGIAGSLVALAIGAAWLARDVSAGLPPDLFARSALLVRYEDFFAYDPAYLGTAGLSLGDLLGVRAGALLQNAGTFLFTYALVLIVPLAAGLVALRTHASVRAWAGLALAVYLAQSLVWTLHSTRGSYFHSLAAFFPFGVAIAAVGAQRLLASRAARAGLAWTYAAALIVGAMSYGAVTQWDASFNTAARARAAAAGAIPDGPFLAIDGAAWRWISGRTAIVTPADGLTAAMCVAARSGARSIVLEPSHFSAYQSLYDGSDVPPPLGPAIHEGILTIYPIRGDIGCSVRRP